jgi:orotidine-5'-phosphate decarboxylase
MEIGMDGIICSPLDVAAVRKITGPAAIVATPGVRSHTANKGDQKRVATPAEALAAGANYIVIGREVTRANDPADQVARILEDTKASLTCSQ